MLNDAISARVEQLRILPSEQLIALGNDTSRTAVVIDGQQYELDVWSEPVSHVAEGVCVVIARLIKRRIVGSTHYMQGFMLCHDGRRITMTERELWHYD